MKAALSETYALEFDPRLVEDSVLLAIESVTPKERRAFRLERDPLYELEDGDEREARFHALHNRWFLRLGLVEGVRDSLAREPSIAAGTRRCLVVPVARAREEYADLKPDRRGEGPPTLLLALRVTTLVDRNRLLPFLRRELVHAADMLDPTFGFEPKLPLLDGSAALENLLRQRYRTLWDTTIDGRLLAAGDLPAEAEAVSRRKFFGAFSMLGDSAERWFGDFFRGPRPSHSDLVAFATAPGEAAERRASGRCPLCRMPNAGLYPDPADLGSETLAAIRHEFLGWQPERGLCLQCADLYASASALASKA